MGGGTTEGTGLVGGGGGEVGGTQHCMRGRGLWKACPGRNPEQAWVGAWKRACSMCPDLAFDSAQNFLEVRRRKTLKSLLLPSARRTCHVQSSAWRMKHQLWAWPEPWLAPGQKMPPRSPPTVNQPDHSCPWWKAGIPPPGCALPLPESPHGERERRGEKREEKRGIDYRGRKRKQS